MTKTETTKQIFSNPFAEVEITPVTVSGQEITSKMAVRVQADDGEWSKAPSIVSSDYKLIRNDVARDIGDDIMSRSGMPWKSLKTLWDGKRWCAYSITENKIGDITGGADNHPVHVGMMLRNSYDGSGVLGLEMFACNMVCSNQYIERNRFGYFAIRHDNARDFDVQDAIENVSRGVDNIMAVAPKLSQMRSMELTARGIFDAHRNCTIPKSMWGDVLSRMALEEATVFGLYQALTNVASHQVGGFSSISVGQSIGNAFLSDNW